MSTENDLDTYAATLFDDPALGLSLDLEAMRIDPAWRASMEPAVQRALAAMRDLEAGAVANPDEGRRVGHYWLRDPSRSPDAETRAQIESTRDAVLRFAADVHAGAVAPPGGGRFERVLVIGIGGSALGPQLVAHALGGAGDKLEPFFFDNTDPDGIDRVLARVAQRGGLARTLTVVISKSGGTKETRNGMLEAAAAYAREGLAFGPHAVAVTGEGSELDRHAKAEGWRARFPMWDWVGGRTSVLSAVGLLPAALQGVDALGLLDGARAMDAVTRAPRTEDNPAALLALAWHHAGGGKGRRDMVILPYKDRLELFSRYLQQLVMESLGKARDLDGAAVHQGIAVYGNKGSTDQHAYVQQLRDGVDNFFVTFLAVLRDRAAPGVEVEPGVTAGDYLHGFLEGTRRALAEGGRPSLCITVGDVDARALGMLIALYERAVGLYAVMVNVNAYHQPGVEAGKRAAAEVLALQARVIAALRAHAGDGMSTLDVARAAEGDVGTVWRMLRHLAASAAPAATLARGATIRDARWRARSAS